MRIWQIGKQLASAQTLALYRSQCSKFL